MGLARAWVHSELQSWSGRPVWAPAGKTCTPAGQDLLPRKQVGAAGPAKSPCRGTPPMRVDGCWQVATVVVLRVLQHCPCRSVTTRWGKSASP